MEIEAAAVYLKMFALKGVGPARVRRAMEAAEQAGLPADEVVAQSGPGWAWEGLFDEGQRAQLREHGEEVKRLASLHARGLVVLATSDPRYPRALLDNLGTSSPPMLFCLGDPTLLQRPGVGFCGSRKASPKGLETAADVAGQLASMDVVVTSGYAAGVDQAAHRAALEAGGSTIIVLPEGIEHFGVRAHLADVWDWARVAVISEFGPADPWTAARAMKRNQTILGLSQAMVLIEAGATGGSMAAGQAALKLHLPLFAPVYEGMPETAVGNRLLLERGAKPLWRSQRTHRAKLNPILDAVAGRRSPSPGQSQLSLL